MRLVLQGEMVPTDGVPVTEMVLPLGYRANVLSLFKIGLKNTDEKLYNFLYGGKPVRKEFTFSVGFDNPHVVKDVGMKFDSGRFRLVFSIPDIAMGLKFFNAFMWLKNNSPLIFAHHVMLSINKVKQLEEKKVTLGSAVVKMYSPLVVNDHDQVTKRKNYLSVENQDKMLEVLMANTKRHLSPKFTADELKDLAFVPLKMHKVVSYAFGIYYEGSDGIMQIKGNPKVVNYLLQSGIGSSKGLGFGNVVLMDQV